MAATAADSLSDAAATTAVLLATLAGHYTRLPLDGWFGLLVALFVLRGGWSAAQDTVSPLLGQPPSPEFVEEVEALVLSHPEIIGVHELIVHDYGPGRLMITLHAEVRCDGDMIVLHDVVDTVEGELGRQMHCLATIHMDPVSCDEAVSEKREEVAALLRTIDERISLHDFRMVEGPTHTNLIFDAQVPFDLPLTGGGPAHPRPHPDHARELLRRGKGGEGLPVTPPRNRPNIQKRRAPGAAAKGRPRCVS